jgi:hypothetical protein
MGIFDNTTKVKRAVSDPATDQTLPHPKSLSWSDITNSTAVAGVLGAHCSLVHGDRSQETHGNGFDQIDGHHDLTVGGDQTVKVGGKHKETILQDCFQNIIGPHVVSNQTVRTETRMGAFAETFGEFDHYDDHDGSIYYAATLNEIVYVFNFEYQTMKMELEPLHIELKGAHPVQTGIEVAGSVLDVAEHGDQISSGLVAQRITQAESQIRGMTTNLGAVKAKLKFTCTPLDPNGTPLC